VLPVARLSVPFGNLVRELGCLFESAHPEKDLATSDVLGCLGARHLHVHAITFLEPLQGKGDVSPVRRQEAEIVQDPGPGGQVADLHS